jgi:PBP1b-binding outer membrane lipoprotein LpoB
MKRKILLVLSTVFIAFFLTGCSTTPTPKGWLVTTCKGPVYGTSNSNGSKTGTSAAYSVPGIVAWGDASVNTAAKNGSITKIQNVDYYELTILGYLFAQYETQVYGE